MLESQMLKTCLVGNALMKNLLLALFAQMCMACVVYALCTKDAAVAEAIAALNEMPGYNSPDYRVDACIRAAVAFQALGEEKACNNLSRFAKWRQYDERIIVLCGM